MGSIINFNQVCYLETLTDKQRNAVQGAMDAWNAKADEFNQWDVLSWGERDELLVWENASSIDASVIPAEWSKPGWDGDDALPISHETKQNALHALGILKIVIPDTEITPNSNGTLSFEWETELGFGYLEIGKTKYSFYVKMMYDVSFHEDGDARDIIRYYYVRRKVADMLFS